MVDDAALRMESPEETAARHMAEDRRTFFPVTVAAVVFVMTILVYVAALIGDEKQPINLRPADLSRQAILQHGVPVMLAEAVLVGIVSFRAMAQDRRTTLKRLQSPPIASAGHRTASRSDS